MSNPLGPPPGQSAPGRSPPTGGPRSGQALFARATPSDRRWRRSSGPAARRPARRITHLGRGRRLQGDGPPSRVPELLGLLISFVILTVTFGSLLTAGMPILTALVGVGVTISAVALVSNVATVNSASPNLAEMLGLAVGIDYALFLLSRYRRQLADPGIPPVVAMSRAMATAGSAVVFAGTTVIIALTGLAVARIPVLTVMGLAAAAAVAVAVLVALTLRPVDRAAARRAAAAPVADGTAPVARGQGGPRRPRLPTGAVLAPAGCAW